jgi:EthD domain
VEKVVYVVWRDPATPVERWSAVLRCEVAPQLGDAGARGVQVNVSDDAVAASIMRMAELDPQMEATVAVWLDSARDAARRPCDAALATATGVSRVAAYLVTESEPLPNTEHPVPFRERTPGFANLAFLRRPAAMSFADWIAAWHDLHTDVAIETQSTFGYVQNVVTRALTPDAPAIDAIVEELFPAEALTSLHAFFAASDDATLADNMRRMTESVARFGADRSLDVVPTSQYVMSRPF